MTLYADSSALLKRYVDEEDSHVAVDLLGSDTTLVTGRHTVVEVRRNLARLLSGLLSPRRDGRWPVAVAPDLGDLDAGFVCACGSRSIRCAHKARSGVSRRGRSSPAATPAGGPRRRRWRRRGAG
jgi:hypothetical protein